MSYPEDVSGGDRPRSHLTNEDSLRVIIMIIAMLMVVIGLPSFFSGLYETPLPAIVMLGFLAVIFSMFYIASKIENMKMTY